MLRRASAPLLAILFLATFHFQSQFSTPLKTTKPAEVTNVEAKVAKVTSTQNVDIKAEKTNNKETNFENSVDPKVRKDTTSLGSSYRNDTDSNAGVSEASSSVNNDNDHRNKNNNNSALLVNEWKSTNPRRIDVNRTLFVCGFDRGRLKDYLFPEFGSDVGRLNAKTPNDEHSFLLFGHGGLCRPRRGAPKLPHIGHKWVHDNWKGTALFVNGEGKGMADTRGNNTFQIGVVPDSNRSVHVLFLAMALIGHYDPSLWQLLFDHSQRPKSQGTYYLIYIASNCVDYREEAFDRLATIHPPAHKGGHCGGKTNNSELVQPFKRAAKGPRAAPWAANHEELRPFRFCLVMENTNMWGYVTEKILNAFLGGCVPIYYGTEEIFDVFNPNAFVYYNISDPEPALERVKHLERNRTAYNEMQSEPILANGEQTIVDYFSLAPNLGNGTLMRKIRVLLGLPEHAAVQHPEQSEATS